MKIKIEIFVILILCLLALSGCSQSDVNNIEDYYYVVAVGIDESDDSKNSDEISVSVQIAMTSSSSDSSSDSAQYADSKIYTATAKTLTSAVSVFDNYLSKKLNFSHCSAVIFSQEIAKKGVSSYITTLANNSEIRPTCKVIVSEVTSLETLEAISNSDESFSSKLYEFIVDSADYTGYSINPQIIDFLNGINSSFPCGVTTYAQITDDGVLQNVGIAVFEGDKFVDNLSVKDSICYSLITNNINICTITIDDPFFDGKYLDISISPKKNTSIKIDLVNGYPYIQIESSFECSINSMNDYFNYESAENTAILESAINAYLEEITLEFLYKISHEYNLDICNFQNIVSSNYLTVEEFEKINWESIYQYSCFSVDVTSSIEYSGLLSSD